jgi:hypothetical protein
LFSNFVLESVGQSLKRTTMSALQACHVPVAATRQTLQRTANFICDVPFNTAGNGRRKQRGTTSLIAKN